MKALNNKLLKQNYPLILSWLFPSLIMLLYFIYRKMSPFGSNTLLTIDLGQQYIDFFRFYRETLLHHPTTFFYSFSKALGGNMIGEWAYYLLSPFNLLLLLFPNKYLVADITWLTLLKYSLSGLSFSYFLKKTNLAKPYYNPLFSTTYALMGWMIVYQLNLLWLDALIFLPLIVLGLYQIFAKKQAKLYVIMLMLLMISSYYMAYMVCIFLVLFTIWYQVTYFKDAKTLLKQVLAFIKYSILSAGLASVILLPTFASLTTSKGQYTEQIIQAKFEYAPWKMLSKLVIGAFNFDQIPQGYPNLFVGTLVLLGTLAYFFSRQIKLTSKITAFLITAFLLLSLCFEPLDLFWHGFQFPVWYPYRFSYLVSFWLLFLAVNAFDQQSVKEITISWQVGLVFLILSDLTLVYLGLHLKTFPFLHDKNLILSAGFLVAILLITVYGGRLPLPINAIVLTLLVLGEMTTNMVCSLNTLSYLTLNDYNQPTHLLDETANALQNTGPGFYRVGQLFMRTKNDGLAHSLNTGSYFSSALEKTMPDFYGDIGCPSGDNYVGYLNGTLITDGLLDYQYYFQVKLKNELPLNYQHHSTWQNSAFRPDLRSYHLWEEENYTRLYRNPLATGLAYLANNRLKHFKPSDNFPTTYQTTWLNDVTNSKKQTTYFKPENFDEVIFQNVKQTMELTGKTLHKIKPKLPAKVIFKFKPQTNNAYYLTLGPVMQNDSVNWLINGKPLPCAPNFRNTIILNVANDQRNQEVVLTAQFKQPSLWLQHFVLYQLNNQLVADKLRQVQKDSLKVTTAQPTEIRGTINVPADSHDFLTTTIPNDRGWKVYIDHQRIRTFTVQNTFLGVNIKPGHHLVTFKYRPPLFTLGLIISSLSWLILLIWL